MPKNSAKSVTKLPIHGLTQRVGVLAAVTFLAMLLVWSSHDDKNDIFSRHRDTDLELMKPLQNVTRGEPIVEWVTAELEQNYTSNLLSRCCLGRRDVPAERSITVDIRFLNIDEENPIELSTGNAHEVSFQALDESGNGRNYGGDYFEVDLACEWWRSRPPTKDMGDGTYSFILQVHPDFAGTCNITIILLFRNFEGLYLTRLRPVHEKQIRKIPVSFLRSKIKLPKLRLCKKSDFNRGLWAGRWTRHAKNDTCEISDDGRYRCLETNYPCTVPWCSGSLGSLESNGWVYSAHCSFALFSAEDAWNCLNNRWLFFWGDSTNVDTIRNMLFFTLGVPLKELDVVSRHFDETFTNPKDRSQSVRITQFWNGHWNVSQVHLGLKTLTYKEHRDFLKSFFKGSVVPDTVLFNSGLHDGRYWSRPNEFANAVDYAISVWTQILEGVKRRGLEIPNFIFRSTVVSASFIRYMGLNPSKMEVFNGILLEKLRAARLITGVIDYFDMTWAWHFDLRTSDGYHYGRFPSTRVWKDGQIGHHYFVDLMLGHVTLNAICST